jgi:hypothetical protein
VDGRSSTCILREGWGQGFARPGLMVMSERRILETLEKDPGTSFLYGHAHEAAHFW